MEKWKIGVIALLIAAFGGFAALQNGASNSAPVPTEATPGEPVQAGSAQTAGTQPAATQPVQALIGTKPIAWSFPASQWANTKRPFTPADLKGKVTVIEFWRMTCSHCEEAVPFMNALQKQYGPRGLQLLTFQSPGDLTDPANPEANWKTVQEWMKERDVQYPVAFDTGRKVKNQYKVELYPMIMIVDRNGVIRYAHTGHTPEKAATLIRAIDAELAKK